MKAKEDRKRDSSINKHIPHPNSISSRAVQRPRRDLNRPTAAPTTAALRRTVLPMAASIIAVFHKVSSKSVPVFYSLAPVRGTLTIALGVSAAVIAATEFLKIALSSTLDGNTFSAYSSSRLFT